jgi:hypothetical protein
MFDGEQATGAQPTPGEADYGGYQPHAVGTTEQCVMRIVLGYFGIQLSTVGNIRRVGHGHVDLSVEFGKQAIDGDIGPQEFHRCPLGVVARVIERFVAVVDANDSRRGMVVGQRDRERAGSGAQIDDYRMSR